MNVDHLLEPQKEHAKKLLDSIYLNGYAFDASDTGTGKTYVACTIAKELQSPLVVICPKVVMISWKRILENEFGIKGSLIINYEKLCRGNTKWLTYDKSHKNKKNWESEGINLNFPKNSLVIFDEVHKCKGYKSLNSDLLVACKNHKYKFLMLSATAATNILEMKAFGYVANLHTGYNFSKFCQMNGAEYNKFGSITIDLQNEAVQNAMKSIHNNLFNIQKSSSRMSVRSFDGLFPENRIFADPFDMGSNTDKINRVYELMQAELDALDERAADYSQHVFAIIMEARRKTELLKVPMMVEWIEDAYENNLSPIVFLNFRDSLKSIEDRLMKKKELKDKIAKICGGQKDKERQLNVDEFQSDVRRIMLAAISAGSTGVSLHDLNGNFARHTLLNPSWSPFMTLQALGRAPRQGGKTPVIQNFLFSLNTIEEKMANRVQGKLECLSTLNDNDLDIGFNLTK